MKKKGRNLTVHPLQAGFTLIELMVAVVVIAILAATAFPAYQNMIETRRLVAATEAVYAQLQFYRSEAIKSGRTNDMNISVKAGTTWCLGMSNATANCDCTDANACLYGSDIDTSASGPDFKNNLKNDEYQGISLLTTKSNLQINDAQGTFSGGGGTITLTSPSSKTTKVIASRVGRVRICSDSSVGGYPSCTP